LKEGGTRGVLKGGKGGEVCRGLNFRDLRSGTKNLRYSHERMTKIGLGGEGGKCPARAKILKRQFEKNREGLHLGGSEEALRQEVLGGEG